MVKVAVVGCGRMGRVHASNAAMHAEAELAYVFDADASAAADAAKRYGAVVAPSIEHVLQDQGVDGIVVATPTPTHVDLIEAGIDAGKAVLCEKPIDLDIARVDACLQRIGAGAERVMIGFQRRFDPSMRQLKDRIVEGDLGRVAQLFITSRDPELPTSDYMRQSGGLLRDMMIHDFDLTRFFIDREPLRITATAGSLVSDVAQSVDDHDSAMVTIEMTDGAQCFISNYRQATYGCDQRVEVVGTSGMLRVENINPIGLTSWNVDGVGAMMPLPFSALDRYALAYRLELDDFIRNLGAGRRMTTTFADGRAALVLANAAYESLAREQAVYVHR